MGNEQEKPNEPPCLIKVYGGYKALSAALEPVKNAIYEYNSIISRRGYYLKPVHMVYRRGPGGTKIYEYYGRYWWRKGEKRLIYAGSLKPRGLPDPPPNPLEGLSIIREGEDVVMPCHLYDRFRQLFGDLRSERVSG